MELARAHKPHLIWMLYFSVLFSSWMCAIDHGQMSGLSLSGLGGQFCTLHNIGDIQPLGDHAQDSAMSSIAGPECMLSSLFSAILLAALFGLLCLLKGDPTHPLPPLNSRSAPRDRWPLANPRASPSLLLSFR
ncbi:DUF2946 family protein [Ectopseudomonas mendocina]|uniref:DUF2946 family protein n=1 Tax=Ectopseudomonas mendocina TaxID=300 RepID=A0ABZ2RL69_ECTME